MEQRKSASDAGRSTRDSIKTAARRLFAERGFDAVSTRDIVAAAGQRNSGAVHYHFGNMENLIRELIVDGARPVDERRLTALAALEAQDRPAQVRELIEVLVRPAIETGPDEVGYVQFLQMLQLGHRREFIEALEGRWNSGWQRTLVLLQQALPDIPAPLLNQRLIFLELFVGAALVKRERALTQGNGSRLWNAKPTLDNLIDTLQALVEAPVSAQTQALAAPTRSRSRRSVPGQGR